MSAELQQFYDQHVRLGAELRKNLAAKRDLNLSRLTLGLADLEKPNFRTTQNQGGYAMHTLNQDHPNGDTGYDIDVAILFAKADLPESPLAARHRVRDALLKRCGLFADVPEARTNAVTIWYAEGYHIDFAVYRTWVNQWGQTVIEHASAEWKARDPSAVTSWFEGRVDALSPKPNPGLGYYPKVKVGQFRRIVRFVKWYCRSRSGWSLPGGMILSALLADGIYRPNADRDDRALYDTLVALRDRLAFSRKVQNPIDGSDLTGKLEMQNQVKRLHEYLTRHLPRLDVLFSQRDCTREKARSAWDWIFNHSFWGESEQLKRAVVEDRALASPYRLDIRCDLSRGPGEKPFGQYKSGSSLLRKGMGLKFTVVSTDVPPPYETEWIIRNEGDEALEAGCETVTEVGSVKETSTAYKGRHEMICRLKKGGMTVVQTVHVVRVAGGWFGHR
ncbi:nucleotide-binding domain-containing protein [Roseomonas sp. KE2513]|uniref:nucleotide-binding domain-containing protein n=1 Tax=Roseomonas sp. KE2513 TaxID=2479202 RepID=UPI0018DF0083|nr:hypothetical protein [Roseomonas sp. KE2513]